MYDGIKIECAISDPRKWDTSLRSIGRYDEATGEVIPFTQAKDSALTFIKVPSPSGKKYIIQGSLHRYARNGAENNDDYTLAQVHETIQRLQTRFGVDPARTRIQNFEFGVNIRLPYGMCAAEFQKYAVSLQHKAFEKMNQRRAAVGYIAEFDEFSCKIYDKGLQSGDGATDKLRFEIKVIRTRWLEQYGVIRPGQHLYLSDLLKKEVIDALGNILQNKISSLICVPRNIDLRKLTEKERLTFYECRDARSWEEWNSKQRERKRAQLQKIFAKVGQQNPIDVLAKLVDAKWRELSRFKVQKCTPEPKQNDAKSSLYVDGICDLLRMIIIAQCALIRELFSTTPESRNKQQHISHLPRGTPLLVHPTPEIRKGYRRWIDLNIRSPTN